MTVDASVDALALVLARLESVVEQVEGVTEATIGNVQSLPDMELPHVVILWGPSSIEQDVTTEDLLYETREYSLNLLALQWSQGLELEAGELCRPFPARFTEAFWTNPGLHTFDDDGVPQTDPLTPVMDAVYTGDTGLVGIQLGGHSWAGVRFFVEVTVALNLVKGQ